jgi:hypothetical protein
MRTYWATLFVLSTCLAHAQNWALLNPAYRYNYSNDGTDTISNQIRVMDVDTLGVDSFRYELNLIGVVCDTCPASLGGPCDGCFVRVDQPQFLGYSCSRSGDDWTFNGVDTFLIKSDASVGDTWAFKNSVSATVDAVWGDAVFGVPDSLKRILLSDGDTIVLSRSLGIVTHGHGLEHYDLLGVQGAGVGVLFADPLAYFNYHPGDELTYKVRSIRLSSGSGGPQFFFGRSDFWKVVIVGREDATDTVTYTTSVAWHYSSSQIFGYDVDQPNWPRPTGQWSFNRTDVLTDHPILGSYPGEVLDTSICMATAFDQPISYMTRCSVTQDGRSVMHSQHLRQSFYGSSSGFGGPLQDAPDLLPFATFPDRYNLWYEEGVGLCDVDVLYGLSLPGDSTGVRAQLVGAVIGGDTIIPPPTINWNVGTDETPGPEFRIHPNPADHTCFISDVIGSEQARVFDLEGRVVLTTQLVVERVALDVSSLAPGSYVVNAEGMRPQRLIIAR